MGGSNTFVGDDVVPVKPSAPIVINPHTTVQQDAYAVHVLNYMSLQSKIKNEGAELRHRQNKVKELHDLIQELNTLIKEDGTLDISERPDVQEMMSNAMDHGVRLTFGKDTYTSHEKDRLLTNINHTVSDLEKENTIQLRKMENYYQESQQSFFIIRNVITSLNNPMRAMIAGIKGG